MGWIVKMKFERVDSWAAHRWRIRAAMRKPHAELEPLQGKGYRDDS